MNDCTYQREKLTLVPGLTSASLKSAVSPLAESMNNMSSVSDCAAYSQVAGDDAGSARAASEWHGANQFTPGRQREVGGNRCSHAARQRGIINQPPGQTRPKHTTTRAPTHLEMHIDIWPFARNHACRHTHAREQTARRREAACQRSAFRQHRKQYRESLVC